MTDDALNELRKEAELYLKATKFVQLDPRKLLSLLDMVERLRVTFVDPWELYYSDEMIPYRTPEVEKFIGMLIEKSERTQ